MRCIPTFNKVRTWTGKKHAGWKKRKIKVSMRRLNLFISSLNHESYVLLHLKLEWLHFSLWQASSGMSSHASVTKKNYEETSSFEHLSECCRHCKLVPKLEYSGTKAPKKGTRKTHVKSTVLHIYKLKWSDNLWCNQ